jgi:hypothetical protein
VVGSNALAGSLDSEWFRLVRAPLQPHLAERCVEPVRVFVADSANPRMARAEFRIGQTPIR